MSPTRWDDVPPQVIGVISLMFMVNEMNSKYWQIGGASIALLIVVLIANMIRLHRKDLFNERVKTHEICFCGYSRLGLESPICPECGQHSKILADSLDSEGFGTTM
jgi:hypothetical protein